MILKHRDTEVMRFDWVEPYGVHVVSVNAAAERYQPIDFRGAPTDENLWKWLTRRIVPNHRHSIDRMLGNLGIRDKSPRNLIGLSMGLSLNDVFWVAEDDFTKKWADVSLYTHPFSRVIAEMAFTGGYERRLDVLAESSTSPEFTTNGMLAKCWKRKNGEILLYKSGTEGAVNTGFEPYSEYYAAQVAEALGLDHVPYGLARTKKRLCSTCPLFTSEKYGFLPAARVSDRAAALKDPRFANIFFFDAIIFNTDRHLGNFGYLVDNDTNEIVGAAPIFDNGYGLFSLAVYKEGANNEFDDLRKFTSRVGPALYLDWLGFPGGLTDEMKTRLTNLKGFRFKQHENFNLPTERLRSIEDFLQKRISMIEQYGAKADDYVKVYTEFGTVKGKNSEAVGTVNQAPTARISVMRAVLENMRADAFVTVADLVDILGVPRRTLSRYIQELQAAGAVARSGADKTGSWSVDMNAFEMNFGGEVRK